MLGKAHFREIAPERMAEFLQKGYKRRHFFPHRVYYLPKCGPDGYKTAYRLRGETDPNKLWELVLYATSPVIDEFPDELFFDDHLVWHQQQFGKVGQVATANLLVDGKALYTMTHISDLVQRISRRREYKTRIENRFKGWPYLLLNAIMNFARENNLQRVFSPTSTLALERTDRKRTVKKELFERVYDRAVTTLFQVQREGGWWMIDVSKNRDRIVFPEKKYETIPAKKTICLTHDIEGGLGHLDVDPTFAEFADRAASTHLHEMLRIEKMTGVKATYNVAGCLMEERRGHIEQDGHCVAFHSFDHKIRNFWLYAKIKGTIFERALRRWTQKHDYRGQLSRCRQVDYRIKGYRPPRSVLTFELSEQNLCYHNFEWLASSKNSLGITSPIMQNRIVKIPVLFGDFKLYKNNVSYHDWECEALNTVKQHDIVTLDLHDCYAHFWLPYYREFLEKVKAMGVFKTLNEVANEVILRHSMTPPSE